MGKKVKVLVDVTENGRKGGIATANNRTPEERRKAARKAIDARWDAYYKAHPDKLAARLARQSAAKKRAKKGKAA